MKITLEDMLRFMEENEIDDARIYAHLSSIDTAKLQHLLRRLDRLDAPMQVVKRTKKQFAGKRDQLKGRVYESLVRTLVAGVKCFQSASNLGTTTNEIDLLITLGPMSRHVPAMRSWGSHCICECKYHTTHVKNPWVGKLNTVLATHGASVGLLFSRKGIAKVGNGTKVRTTLQLLAVKTPASYVLCFDQDDLSACINGKNFLELLSERFVEARAGIEKLTLLAS